MPAAKKKKRPVGRPPKPIDGAIVEKLAQIGCSIYEISHFFEVDDMTIRNRFQAECDRGKNNLKRMLRKKQVEMALGGDRTMLIWLGKQLLDQRETPTVAIQNNVEVNQEAPQRKRTSEENREFIRLFNKAISNLPSSPDPHDRKSSEATGQRMREIDVVSRRDEKPNGNS